MQAHQRAALPGKVEAFAASPFARYPWAEAMRGRDNQVRVRQGEWRALLLIVRDEDAVILERAGHCRKAYR
jgi:mRNA-degrading endonuclease RelE of RelBE toxin-antitoxin system